MLGQRPQESENSIKQITFPNMDDKLFTYDDEQVESKGPVTCLGITFANDDERREYFRNELRKKLPELKLIEGFPIGEDEDIINLSDPPYYTACPNPWIKDIVREWELSKKEISNNYCVSEPYGLSVSEKKNSAIYNAHSYHTKVPPEVIMNYYLYYTKPGDIVIDSFAGTGMAGVAANYCEHPTSEQLRHFNEKWLINFKKQPEWGKRNCVLGDISPICSYITYNYCNTVNKKLFIKAASEIYKQLEDEYGYLYKFKTNYGIAEINYIVWSECQVCPNCNEEFVYWDAAINILENQQLEEYPCPHCGALINKSHSIKSMQTEYDRILNETTSVCKFVPVFINYSVDNHRYEEVLDDKSRKELCSFNLPDDINVPISKLEKGDKTIDPFRLGIYYLHQFYTKKNLTILARFKDIIESYQCDERLKSYLRIWFTSCQSRLHMMNRYAVKHHRHVGPLANTFYVSSTPTEISPFYFIKSKIKDNNLDIYSEHNIVNQIVSASCTGLEDNSIDYIFTDPPFGSNIMYSELNFIWESWLNLRTNNKEEAISNKTQGKTLFDYQNIMTRCFKEYYRVLKPGRWITIEFSNTSASVWNSIQLALQNAGFIVTYVADLNKGRAGLHGILGVVAVNQDLAISCYKPSEKLSTNFIRLADNTNNIWDFVDELLRHLPIHTKKGNTTTAIVERSPKILYDRLIAFYVQHGYSVPLNAIDFQKGLRERFVERDGMFFTVEQAIEYEEKKKETDAFESLSLLVGSESEGIEWLNRLLSQGPRTYQDIQPDWMQNLVATKKGDKLPELKQVLEENFLKDDHDRWFIPDINNQAHLQEIKRRRLLREFNVYVSLPKIKGARLEALRAGFNDCYNKKDFETIIKVGNKLPEELLMTDEVLLRFYDIASSRV